MKWIDPGIETVACVSSSPFLAHYPQWDLEALQECYETVDTSPCTTITSRLRGTWGSAGRVRAL